MPDLIFPFPNELPWTTYDDLFEFDTEPYFYLLIFWINFDKHKCRIFQL